MSEQDLNKNMAEQPDETEILRNEYGKVPDPNVVIDEPDRTVLLTENETIVIEKEPQIDIAPVNRARKVYRGMWGPVEIGVAGAGMLAILGAVLMYVFFVVPSNRELENHRARRENLQKELDSAKAKFGGITDVEHRVAELVDSVGQFESQYLPISSNGRTALYQRINALIQSNRLINTSGPDYSPLEMVDVSKGGEEDKSGKGKFRSFFPGVYVSMTVEGSYQDLRRFINDLEAGNDFVVVSTIELEPSDSQGERQNDERPKDPTQSAQLQSGFNPITMQPTQMNPGMMQQPQPIVPDRSKGKTRGNIVSLHIELAAYFRRPATEAPTAALSQQQ